MEPKQSTFTTQILTRPWWLLAGNHIKGRVLMIGEHSTDSIECASQIADYVALLDIANDPNQELLTSNHVELLDEPSGLFDTIVIKQKYQHFNEDFLSKLYEEHLTSSGVMLIQEPNGFRFKKQLTSAWSTFTNLFFNKRKRQLLSAAPEAAIKQYCSHSRDGTIRYSFKPGYYQSNKNAFLLREKFKAKVLNSFAHRLFHNSNLWVVTKSSNSVELESLVKQSILDSQVVDFKSELQCSSIFYKFGKLILTFQDVKQSSDNTIVVIAVSDTAISQRDNEYLSIQKLSHIPALNKYLTSKVTKKFIAGFNCYLMKETKGLTVDVPSKHSTKMELSASSVILELAKETKADNHSKESLIPLVDSYASKIKSRIPSSNKQIDQISAYVTNAIKCYDFPCVCLHGDLKLENFVLSSQYNVVGIIDWELCEMQSFPLLDQLYLISYNHQTAYGEEFHLSFDKIWNRQLKKHEQEMIDNYCKELKISSSQEKVLLIVFFLHHYGERYLLMENGKQPLGPFQTAVSQITAFIDMA